MLSLDLKVERFNYLSLVFLIILYQLHYVFSNELYNHTIVIAGTLFELSEHLVYIIRTSVIGLRRRA